MFIVGNLPREHGTRKYYVYKWLDRGKQPDIWAVCKQPLYSIARSQCDVHQPYQTVE